MARVKSVTVSGSMDNLTFYTLNGKLFSRKKIKNVRQTEATKKSAKKFARAIKISAALRKGLPDVFTPKDKKVMYRVNNAVFKAFRRSDDSLKIVDIWHIEQLQFNVKASITGRIRIDFKVDWDLPGKVVITIPSFIPVKDISAPSTTRTVYWTITLTGFTVNEHTSHTCSHTFTTQISYNETEVQEQVLEIPYVIWPGNMYIVALNMQCDTTRYGQPVKVKNMVWLPSGIIAAHIRPVSPVITTEPQ